MQVPPVQTSESVHGSPSSQGSSSTGHVPSQPFERLPSVLKKPVLQSRAVQSAAAVVKQAVQVPLATVAQGSQVAAVNVPASQLAALAL
jgi:hypothetical protein